METTTPEISPPVGYFRADEALKRWLEIRHGHDELQGKALATMLDASRSRKSLVAGLKARKGLMFLVDSNGERQDVDHDEWKSDGFLFRELTTQDLSGRPILCISQNEIERWARQELKEWLFDELRYSRLDFDKARDVWAKAGTGNLEGNPDPAEFDPMGESFWTLPMAVAWIAWGDPQEVVKQWGKYREQCGHFHWKVWHFPEGPEHKGWVFDNDEPANLDCLFSENWTPAKHKLWRALQAGDLTATGFDPDGYRLLIDAFLWQDHGATLGAWKDITVAAKDVLLVCGSSQGPEVQPAAPSPIQKSLKKKLLGSDVMKDWAKNHMLTNKDNPTSKKDEMELLAVAYPEYRRPTRAPYTLARDAAAAELNMKYWIRKGPKGAKPVLKNVDSVNLTENVRTNYAAQLRDDIRINKKTGT